MKKLIPLLLLVSFMSACSEGTELTESHDKRQEFFTDKDTGCQYIIGESGSIAPRYEKKSDELTIKGCR